MAFRVVCECGKKLAVNEEMAGKRIRCPACQAVMTAPSRLPTTTRMRFVGVPSIVLPMICRKR